MRSVRKKALALLTGACLLAATGCGLDVNAALPFQVLPGSIQPVPELRGLSVTVGSKDFTENILLGYMAEMALSAAGANVVDLTNITGSNSARQALVGGQIDLYWEYTGTAWISYQGNTDPIPDERAQFEAVKKADEQQNSVTWLDFSPINNTYAFAAAEAFAARHNLRTVTDMTNFVRQHPEQGVFCVETEFSSRADGFPGVRNVYGIPVRETKLFGIGTIYSLIASGSCPFGETSTTDGRIAGLNLRVLDDDRKFFPQYNASVTLRNDYLRAHPELRRVLEPVAKAIDNKQMIELGKQVDIDGRDAGDVARDWMVAKGFIKTS
ncbi:glycine betaine ABC transporter substrate-binding protein [Amycolatopsis anabasis]|uniref:glycine betaine ABC transporter substrate-binding protein n=1 Tax=Amycolatopsis anabasis TaxID=1840409 RepID=UPI00131DBEA4|nr:glycine betaine ABC transporter substrate-binding protein [Amycolatopsis anabasis]